MFTSAGRRLAVRATALFAAAAVAGALATVHDWSTSAPLVGFHALLLLNTYFSVRCFASIAARQTVAQLLTDGALLVVYFLLPFQFADPTRYLWTSVALFVIANIKYALMLRTPGHATLVKLKMMLNFLAAATCMLALAGVTAGISWALGCWLGVFLLANIYLLLMSRIYFPVAEQAPSS